MTLLHIDFETRSPVPINTAGAYGYATHPDTAVLCMAWAFDEDAPALWTPGDDFPAEVVEHIERGKPGSIHAHNAQFERLIFWYILCPELDIPEPAIEMFTCTVAWARARGLPGALALVSRMRGGAEKQAVGDELIRACCIPPYDTSRLSELYDYCLDDVNAERAFCVGLAPMTDDELTDYWVSEYINDRGVGIDLEFARAARVYKDDEVADIGRWLVSLTRGVITKPTQQARIRDWIIKREPRDCLRSDKTKTGWTTDKAALGILINEETDVDPDVIDVAQARLDGANTSVAKYAKMVALAEADEDGRIRGAFQFNAAITGRFSSRGLQLHNFPRRVPDTADAMIRDVVEGYELDNPMADLASLLRPTLKAAPGKRYFGGDWSGIEARLTPWFATPSGDGEGATFGAQELLDTFAAGEDIYVRQAEDMGVDERQVGKVAVLACGFGGMGNAFVAMARAYGLKVPFHEGNYYAKLWRQANPWAEYLWRDLEGAAKRAIASPGEVFDAGRVRYMVWDDWLVCELPSKRCLYYYRPKLVENKFGGMDISYIHARYVSRTNVDAPPRVRTWGGKLCENVVQAAANDLLRGALVAAHARSLPVIAHVHDSILGECDADQADVCRERLERIMLDRPGWAGGLPLAADMWIGERFVK